MEITKIDTLDERDLLVSLIMSDKCCSVLLPFANPEYFTIDYARIVLRWIQKYYNEFHKAPKQDMMSIYRLHCLEVREDATRDLLLTFLQKLDSSSDVINNEDYTIDRGREFLEYKKLSVLCKDLQACLDLKDISKAKKLQKNYQEVNVATTNEISLLDADDLPAINDALTHVDEALFTLPKPISDVFGILKRGDFVSLCAGMKMGKSFGLAYISSMALLQGLKVVFFSLEMSCDEVVQRLWTAYAGAQSPTVPEGLHTLSHFVPDENAQGCFRVEQYDYIVKKDNVSLKDRQKQMRMYAHSGNIRIVSYPAYSVNMTDITQKVQDFAAEGFVADLIVIDYIDITKPSGGGDELRNQLDYNWKVARSFAQTMHALVLTATQTNRGGLGGKVSTDNVAEDIRKLAHVTSMVAIERTPLMKKQHLCRLSNMAVRNSSEHEPAVFCQALDLGQFVFGPSYPESLVTMTDEKSED